MILSACGSASTTAPAQTSSASEPSSGAEAAVPESASVCEELATVCHGHDAISALVKECHLVGHSGDAEACAARRDDCLPACREAAAAH
jgi:hypothetical protein